MSRRAAGILLHPTSLPGSYGIGDLGPEAERFLDWVTAAGQSIWQVLPLGPTSFGHSPYVSQSLFAGNPLLISPERLRGDGLLGEGDLGGTLFPADAVDFAAVEAWKRELFRVAFEAFRGGRGAAELRANFDGFREAPEQRDWLPGWALFAALKERRPGDSWLSWDSEIRRRDADAIARVRETLGVGIEFQEFLQFLFFRQWGALRRAAQSRGIAVFGDTPIYVALDSVDVWENPQNFQLDADGHPTAVSGVPPDYFSETGQLWGTPLYDWGRMETDGFSWWSRRFRGELRKCDLLRVDHFRGFQAYWSVPAGARTAKKGRWQPGPGIRLFHAVEGALGKLPLVAEDLGDITDDVRELLRETGYPGMRVLQFAFGSPDSTHLPHHIPANSVAYTGTHDNDTTRGWFESLGPEERARVLQYVGGSTDNVVGNLIRVLYTCAADRVVVPVQDVLGLGSEARMNVPSVAEGNWTWRMREGALTGENAEWLAGLATASGR
jgi:4-alpha-glucanotransferase